MTPDKKPNKTHLALIGSATLNIFLLAFVIGRLSMEPPAPPPPPPGGPPGMEGEMPPPPPPGAARGDMPAPPPFISPAGLFSPEEMKENSALMKENFQKMREMRKAFAEKLREGNVSREDVIAHFNETDKIMDNVRQQTQDKVADKILSMSIEDRQRFADKMMQEPRHERRMRRRDDSAPPPPEETEPPAQ